LGFDAKQECIPVCFSIKSRTSPTDLAQVESALEGAWGAYINTDGFTVGEKAETYYGLRIFELAVRVPTLKHYVCRIWITDSRKAVTGLNTTAGTTMAKVESATGS
jgi:hypothetical protein